jgi:hypothetical protein
MKHDIKPFKDFSFSCFSAILFTLINYVEPENKISIYANNYVYEKRLNTHPDTESKFISLCVKSDITLLESVLLQDKKTINVKTLGEGSILEKIIELLDEGKIVLVEIDLYYGICDNLHYHKNHLFHMLMVNGYDEKKQIFYVFDTGNKGYKEYEMSFGHLENAIISATGKLNFYTLGRETKKFDYGRDFFVMNAASIIESIQAIAKTIDSVWNIQSFNIREIEYFRDKVLPNLYGMKHRQRANKKLIYYMDEKYEMEEANTIGDSFQYLEEEFGHYELMLGKMCRDGSLLAHIEEFRTKILALLMEECEVWKKFIEQAEKIKN